MKRKALLMIELLIAMLIIAVTAGAFSLSADIWTVTAKREAEKLAAKLNTLKLRADFAKLSFELTLDTHENAFNARLTAKGISTFNEKDYTDTITADKGCSYSWNVNKLSYSYLTNRFSQGATITVTGRGPTYYVIIATIGGRVRVSSTKPSAGPDKVL